jgi:hypothetical protein
MIDWSQPKNRWLLFHTIPRLDESGLPSEMEYPRPTPQVRCKSRCGIHETSFTEAKFPLFSGRPQDAEGDSSYLGGLVQKAQIE